MEAATIFVAYGVRWRWLYNARAHYSYHMYHTIEKRISFCVKYKGM